MKKTLIDSHVLLWLLYEPDKIGEETIKLINSSKEVFVSLASLYELTLKYKKGKLLINPNNLLNNINDLGADILPITERHILSITDVDSFTRDPFDILLMSQAKSEDLLLITADSLIVKSKLHYVINARL